MYCIYFIKVKRLFYTYSTVIWCKFTTWAEEYDIHSPLKAVFIFPFKSSRIKQIHGLLNHNYVTPRPIDLLYILDYLDNQKETLQNPNGRVLG